MIIIDTSVWADHFRQPVAELIRIIRAGDLAMHPFVVGELAAGSLRDWAATVSDLRALAGPVPVTDDRFYELVGQHHLMGSGLGFVDLHLLLSTLEQGCRLWATDKRLAAQAERLGCAYVPR